MSNVNGMHRCGAAYRIEILTNIMTRFADIVKYAVLTAALLFVTIPDASAQFFGRKTGDKKSRKELIRENQRLKVMLDSLSKEIEALKDTAYIDEAEVMVAEGPASALDGLSPEDYTVEVTDSLLSIWYHHRLVTGSGEDGYNMDSVKFSSDVPDKVLMERIAAMNSFITLPYNETVRNYIILYSEKMPVKLSHMLSLSQYYFPVFEAILNKYDLPEELKYMAVIESALNPVASSRAGAKGMWQFMYTAAKSYGLRIDSFVDERLDPFTSADAAARYLRDAYRIFGDWNLAISAYNCGSGNVSKAIRRCGGSKNFWDVYAYLPRETRGYVPAFVGAMYAFKYYKEYGIEPEPVSLPVHTDTFNIRRPLHFQQVSALTDVPMQTLKDLNSQYVHDIIPGGEKECVLRLPYQYSGRFIENEDSIYTYKAKELLSQSVLKSVSEGGSGQRTTYKVKSGDYLGKIASRYHVTVAQLKKWNHLRNNNLRIGQVLVIYGRGASSASSASASAAAPSSAKGTAVTSASKNTVPAGPAPAASAAPGTYVEYVVRNGDTLYGIAKAYPGVSANDIMKFNGISSSIHAGLVLRIPKKPF